MTNQQHLSRRKFLKAAGIGAVGVVMACSGLGVAALRAPKIKFIETSNNGANNMEKKVLVAYASKAGSTGEVAEAIAEVIRTKGWGVDVKLVKHVNDLSTYQAVIIGSCIRMGSWLPEAVNLVKDHQAELGKLPTAYFLTSSFLENDTPETRKTVAAYLDPVRAVLEPMSVGLFAGKVDYSKLSFFERMMAKAVKSQEGDFRNWDAIKVWAAEALPGL